MQLRAHIPRVFSDVTPEQMRTDEEQKVPGATAEGVDAWPSDGRSCPRLRRGDARARQA